MKVPWIPVTAFNSWLLEMCNDYLSNEVAVLLTSMNHLNKFAARGKVSFTVAITVCRVAHESSLKRRWGFPGAEGVFHNSC